MTAVRAAGGSLRPAVGQEDEYRLWRRAIWRERGWQTFMSSGTTGRPRVFRYTSFDRTVWSWVNARALWAMGFRPGRDSAMLAFGYGPHVREMGMDPASSSVRYLFCAGEPGVSVASTRRRGRGVLRGACRARRSRRSGR